MQSLEGTSSVPSLRTQNTTIHDLSGLNYRKKRQWPLQLYECFDYRDLKGDKRWMTDFCCYSLCCGSMMIAKVYSRLHREKSIYGGIGCTGLMLCCALAPCTTCLLCQPCGAMFLSSNHLRKHVKRTYYVEEPPICTCCPLFCQPIATSCHYGCNAPCSLFQMYMSMERWDEELMHIDTVVTPIHGSNHPGGVSGRYNVQDMDEFEHVDYSQQEKTYVSTAVDLHRQQAAMDRRRMQMMHYHTRAGSSRETFSTEGFTI